MLPCFDLSGLVIVLTGASKGLGRAFAEALAASGATVLGISRNQEDLASLKREIESKGGIFEYKLASIIDENAIKEAADFCTEKFGKVDVLVNNAGTGRVNKPFEDITVDEWNASMENNLTGTFICCKYFGQKMIMQKRGKIVNLSSMSGFIANAGVHCGPYEVTKHGIVALTKSLASEWAEHNITVNALAPGYIATDRNQKFFDANPAFAKTARDMTLIGRIPPPSELGGAMVFLCSDASNYMNGAVLLLDGGYCVR